MIRLTFDHEYAGDLASLGIEYQSRDNDHEIECMVAQDHELFDQLYDASNNY